MNATSAEPDHSRTPYWLWMLGIVVLAYLISQYWSHGLQRYPGPFLAKFTKLWYFLDVKSNKHHLHLLDLHRKYGDVVRIGPTSLSIARPDYVSRVYSLQAGYSKGPMYDVFDQRVNGKRMSTTLSQRNERIHAQMTRPVAGAYNLSVLGHYEPLIDEVCEMLLRKLDDIAGDAKSFPLDFSKWSRLYAMDVILYLTFGSTKGFIETGEDLGGFFDVLDSVHDQAAILSAMPWTSLLVKFNPVVGYFSGDSSAFSKWCMNQVHTRQAERAEGAERKEDFLDKFLDAAKIDTPPGTNYAMLLDWCIINFSAGSDTVTIAIRAVIYYLLKSPERKAKLVAEIRSANLTHPVSYAAAQKLPYLDACIKESLRLHPPIGLGMERVTPNLEMPDGYQLPANTVVSMNPWVVNRQSLFGEEPDEWRPERWLRADGESEAAHHQRILTWKRADLVFSLGSHSCTGKNVAFMEMYKLIPTLFLKYDMALKHPDKDWTVVNRWVVRQSGIDVIFTRRNM